MYTAATVLLAARLQPILNTDINYSMSESWDHAIQVLHAFERLGQSAQRCVAALEILSAKVPKLDPAGNTPSTEHEAGLEVNISQDFEGANLSEYPDGFDFGGIEIDLSDMSWLNIVPGNLY